VLETGAKMAVSTADFHHSASGFLKLRHFLEYRPDLGGAEIDVRSDTGAPIAGIVFRVKSGALRIGRNARGIDAMCSTSRTSKDSKTAPS
jgi:hypothetical protein